LDILALILPVFGVVILGFVCVKIGVVPVTIAEPLVQFVYHICLPALMFHIVATGLSRLR
jgi:predicted permease